MSTQKSLTPIWNFLEILIALSLYNAFIQWPRLNHWVSYVIGIFLFLLIINGWFSLRAAEPFYRYETVFYDLGAIFAYLNIFSSIINPSMPNWGYSPSFFLYMFLICICYAGWDNIATRMNESIGDSKSATVLKKWSRRMILSASVYLLEFTAISWLAYSDSIDELIVKYIAWGLALIGIALFSVWLFAWNHPKYVTWKSGTLEL